MKKTISIILILTLSFVMVFSASGMAFGATKSSLREAYEKTGDYLYNLNKDNISYEQIWTVYGLNQAGYPMSEEYIAKFKTSIEDYVRDCEGQFVKIIEYPDGSTSQKGYYSDYSKFVLITSEMGWDPTDVAGYNLLDPIASWPDVLKQGLNGPVWALIALDSTDKSFSEEALSKLNENTVTTKERIIDFLLTNQKDDGGWSLGSKSDPDMTGITLKALASHRGDSDKIAQALDKALECVASMQTPDGGFSTRYSEMSDALYTCESDAWTIWGLCAMGIDPYSDERFIKNGSSPFDDLMSYYVEKTGGFKHVDSNTSANYLASYESYYTLAYYYKNIVSQTADEEKAEESQSALYIDKIAGLRSYIAELKAIISDSASEVEKYKAQAEKYKAEADKYKTLAQKNGVMATTIKLSGSQIKVSGKPAVKLSWSKNGSYAITKYQIYRSTKEASGYKLISTQKSSVKTYKDTSVKKGKTYYYKVRAYKIIDGSKVYTQWSPIYSIKIS